MSYSENLGKCMLMNFNYYNECAFINKIYSLCVDKNYYVWVKIIIYRFKRKQNSSKLIMCLILCNIIKRSKIGIGLFLKTGDLNRKYFNVIFCNILSEIQYSKNVSPVH